MQASGALTKAFKKGTKEEPCRTHPHPPAADLMITQEDRPQGGKQAQTGGPLWTVQRHLPAHPAGEAAHLSLAFTGRAQVPPLTLPILRQNFFLKCHDQAGIPKETKHR